MLTTITVFVIIANTWLTVSSGGGQCPHMVDLMASNQQPQPCLCRTNTTGATIIVCNGDQPIDMSDYFKQLSHQINHNYDNQSVMDELVINNTAITSLSDQFTANITFTRITISDAWMLEKMSSNAFGLGNRETVDELLVMGESRLGGDGQDADEMFNALASLRRARKVWLDRNRLTSIPSVAFGKISGADYQLEDLNFNAARAASGQIQSIGNYAFYYLNRLRHLYLSHQRIDYVPANAFDFQSPSNHTLYIYLGNNRLNNTSFERGAFLNAKRPVHLELYWNHKLTYLDEQIWSPFLQADPRNIISLGDNPLACDCKSYWMVKDRDRFKDQITNVKCKVGPNKVFNIDLIPFDQCTRKKSSKLRIINR